MKLLLLKKVFLSILSIGIVIGFIQSAFASISLWDIIRAKVEKARLERALSLTWNSTTPKPSVPSMPTPIPTSFSGKMMSGSLISGGRKRMYMVYVPANYNRMRWGPAVMAFHGGWGTMKNMSEEYELIEKADKEGFLAVFPNGTSSFKSGIFWTWNAGECCGYAVEKNVDDVKFVRTLAKKLVTDYRVKKYFAIGMSNGGLMSYRLACEASDIFSAIGSVAGTDNTTTCNPTRPIPVMHIHALNDPNVVYTWGCGPDCQGDSWAIEFQSVPDTISKWVKLNKCSPEPTTVLTNSWVTCVLYSGCTNKASVKLCTTTEGGHSWPGTDGNDANPNVKETPSQTIDANDELWNFFNSQKVIQPY
jgi:polyhydroxybutyrate depolymerase